MVSLTVAGAVSIALAGPAVAADRCANGHFCAYAGLGCTNKFLDSTGGRPGTRIGLADRAIRGADNNTDNVWIFRHGLREVFRLAPHTRNCSLPDGTSIDHLEVR